MIERVCKTCKWQKATLIRIDVDDEGKEKPVFDRYCNKYERKLYNLDDYFSCGSWEERV